MRKQSLFYKFLSFSYGPFIGAFLGFITTILMTNLINPTDFGKISMFLLTLNISSVLVTLGTDQSFIRFFYEEDELKRPRLLYNSIKIPFVFSLILLVVILIFYKNISNVLFGEINIYFILLLVLIIIIQLFYKYSLLVIRMKQKGNLYSFMQILNRFLELAFIILFIFLLGPTYDVIVYTMFFQILILTIIAILSEKEFWLLTNNFKDEVIHKSKDILKYGSPLLFAILINWLLNSFDKIGLRIWSDFSEIGLYDAAFRITGVLIIFQSAFSTFWAPTSYERFETNSKDKEFFSKITHIVAFCMFTLTIFTIMFKDVIIKILGSEYEASAAIIPFLVFIPLMYTISETTVIGINFYKKTSWHVFIAGTAAVINIIGNWILIPSFGGIGAGIATAVSYIVFFTLRTVISQRYYKVDYGLNKIYIMILITIIYGLISISLESLFKIAVLGIAIVIINVFLFYKEANIIVNSIKNIRKDFKQKRNGLM